MSLTTFDRVDVPLLRGNLHSHTDLSDGLEDPSTVARSYAAAGYDFLVLSDHFEEAFGWSITDPTAIETDEMLLIRGAELSSGPWEDPNTVWVTAVGIPQRLERPSRASWDVICRAHSGGAHTVLLHPGLNRLSADVVQAAVGTGCIDAIEVYNHSMASTWPDYAAQIAVADVLLDVGYRVGLNAGDDGHGDHRHDRFGGWVMVRAEPTAEAVIAALRAQAYYATQGPDFHDLAVVDHTVEVACSPCRSVTATGPARAWAKVARVLGDRVEQARLDVAAFAGSYVRITIVDSAGRRAWSNPIWLP